MFFLFIACPSENFRKKKYSKAEIARRRREKIAILEHKAPIQQGKFEYTEVCPARPEPQFLTS